MKNYNPNKPNRFVSAFAWWIIDQVEYNDQVFNYHTLGLGKSARKLSSMLLLGSAALTLLFSIANPYSVLPDVIVSALLAVFIYQGHRWAAVSGMIFWTFEKGYLIFVQSGHPVSQLLWWSILMKPFYLAYVVGRNPKIPSIPDDNRSTTKEESA